MTLHRRTILRGAGAAAIALPFLPSVHSRAGTTDPPKRLVFWFTGNGTVQAETASGGEHDFVLGPILAPLAAHRDDLLVLRGIDMESSYHGISAGQPHAPGMAHMLTGTEMVDADPYPLGGGISVDQFIAQQLAAPTRFPTLDFGVASGLHPVAPEASMSYHGAANPVIRQLDPMLAFDQCFADLGGDIESLDRLRARRQSILDFVGDETTTLQAQLGSEDRVRLEQHLDAVRALELSLDGLAELPGACEVPDAPVGIDYQDKAATPQVGAAFLDLLAMGLACDLARVATLQWGGALGANGVFSWLSDANGAPFAVHHHDISHDLSNATSRERKIAIDAWYAGQLGQLIDRLKALPEGDGTVFDTTAIVWVNELSNGQAHSRRDMVYVIAGGCGGHFDTGRFLQFAGTPHNDLLVSLCHAAGVDVQTFGNPAYCTGPLSGLI